MSQRHIAGKSIELSELEECIILREYLDLLQQQGRVVLYTHIPNNTYTTSWNAKRKNKQLGLRGGFPDYFILTRNNTLFLEMKVAGRKGVVSPAQKQWIDALTQARHAVYVAHGFNDARRFIDNNI